jgi:hypothetical protein
MRMWKKVIMAYLKVIFQCHLLNAIFMFCMKSVILINSDIELS